MVLITFGKPAFIYFIFIFFDCIFIDGLHIYEQARQDVLNSVKFLKTDGIIILHDCLPNKIWNQIVPQIYGHWNGDVWKAIVEARTLNDLDTYTCIADNGLGIIFKRKNRNPLVLKNKNFKNLKYKDYYVNHKLYMNLVEVSDNPQGVICKILDYGKIRYQKEKQKSSSILIP